MFTLFLKCCLSSVALVTFFYSSAFVPGLMASSVFSSDMSVNRIYSVMFMLNLLHLRICLS